MQIIQITELDQKRVRLLFDTSVAENTKIDSIVLYKKELKLLDLYEGGEFTALKYQQIRNEILLKRARKRGMHLLEKMDRTEEELRKKLRQGYYTEDIIDEVTEYLKNYHYIDDLRYAGNFIRYQSDKKSLLQMKAELLRKGVSKDIIEEALEAEYRTDSTYKLIERWLQKKHYCRETADNGEKQKIYRFLLRKGFYQEDILYVLDHLT